LLSRVRKAFFIFNIRIFDYNRPPCQPKQERPMIFDWPETTKKLSSQLRDLRSGEGAAEVMKSFSAMAQNATKGGALDAKTKELIALAIGVATRCDDCIAFHAKAAANLGAAPGEIQETLGMAIYMGAGPSVMYASHAWQAFSEFAAQKTDG
jgi:AhpD family alkylhydroperoxidase